MIIGGIVLAFIGFWLFPDVLPQIPAQIDLLFGDLGVLLVVVGVILWILGAVGHPFGPRRHYW